MATVSQNFADSAVVRNISVFLFYPRKISVTMIRYLWLRIY